MRMPHVAFKGDCGIFHWLSFRAFGFWTYTRWGKPVPGNADYQPLIAPPLNSRSAASTTSSDW